MAGVHTAHGQPSRSTECPPGRPRGPAPLPLLGDIEHHDHPVAVLVHVQELGIQGHLGLRLGMGESGLRDGAPGQVPQVSTRQLLGKAEQDFYN